MDGQVAHRRLIEERVLARRLEAIETTAPFFGLALLASVLLIVLVMERNVAPILLYGWAAAIVLLLAGNFGHPARFLLRSLFPVRDGTNRHARRQSRFALHSLLLNAGSVVWAAGLVGFTYIAEPDQYAALGVVGTAVFTGVLLIHRYVPRAALFHIVVMTISGFAGLAIASGAEAWPLVVLVLIYALVLVRSIIVHDIGYIRAITTQVAHEEAENTIRVLLTEYEVQSQDWLWTIGPNGNLREVSERLAETCGTRPDALEGTPFLDLFAPGARRERLERLLVEKKAFADELVVREGGGELRYWRLSARPRSDGRMTGAARDVTDTRIVEERVAYMAHHDDLTGLANRYSFNERLTIELQRRRRSDEESGNEVAPLTLFYCDLDDFKGVNDTYGHGSGDRLLREVARRLESQLRPEDMVARIGGDEFVVLLEMRAGNAIVIERAHRLLAALRRPYSIDGNTVTASASIGIARSGPDVATSEQLVYRADLALQDAKRKGRDQIALYAPALDVAMRQRRQVEHDLRNALSQGALKLHYQPVINLENGATAAYEALVRWDHPTRGMLTPDQFLPIAEETGLIVPLGEWVINTALTELSQWDGNFRVAINLSPSQLHAPDLIPVLAAALSTSSITASRLEIEVTEHVLLQDVDATLRIFNRLRELGVRIGLDDFGTGYSSLSYLQLYSFDRIKIDRGFVQDLDKSASARAIVAAVTRLAATLEMKTTAEGVEDAAQLDLLRKLGCDEAQGFLICEPKPIASLLDGDRLDGARTSEGSAEVLDYRRARDQAAGRRSHRLTG